MSLVFPNVENVDDVIAALASELEDVSVRTSRRRLSTEMDICDGAAALCTSSGVLVTSESADVLRVSSIGDSCASLPGGDLISKKIYSCKLVQVHLTHDVTSLETGLTWEGRALGL